MTARTIDGHRHIMCLQAHQLANSIDPMQANALAGVGPASAAVNLEKAPEWFRKMTDFDEHIADMDAAGIDIGVIWPPPPGFYYWAEPSAGLELARAKCKHPFPYYLKNFFVDSVAFRPETIRFVTDILPPGHVFMGTDYPFDMADPAPISSVRAAFPQDDSSTRAILSLNLQRLLKL